MAGVLGEATAVLTVLEVGFSLVRTLHGYIGDYKDARDDIISLATEIDSTLTQIKDLDTLLKSNPSAKALDNSGSKIALKCTKDSDRLISKIIDLLAKAGVLDSKTTKPEDIVLSRLGKVYWTFYKYRAEAVKRELDSLRILILLTRNCIEARVGHTSVDRNAAAVRIVPYEKRRQVAQRDLEAAISHAAEEDKRYPLADQDTSPNGKSMDAPMPSLPRDRSSQSPIVPRYVAQEFYQEVQPRDPHGRSTDVYYVPANFATKFEKHIREEYKIKDEELSRKEADLQKKGDEAMQAHKDNAKSRLDAFLSHAEAIQKDVDALDGQPSNLQIRRWIGEQQISEMEEEFGSTLISLAIQRPSRAVLARSALSIEDKTQTTIESENKSVDSIQRNQPSEQDQHFVHLALLHDSNDKYLSYPCDTLLLGHNPCTGHCDFRTTLQAYGSLPTRARDYVWKKANEYFGKHNWSLHAAIPHDNANKQPGKLRQRLLLGELVSRQPSSLLLVLSRVKGSGNVTGAGIIASGPDNPPEPLLKPPSSASEQAASRDLPASLRADTKYKRVRGWLKRNGLRQEKIDEFLDTVLQDELAKSDVIADPITEASLSATTDTAVGGPAPNRASKQNISGDSTWESHDGMPSSRPYSRYRDFSPTSSMEEISDLRDRSRERTQHVRFDEPVKLDYNPFAPIAHHRQRSSSPTSWAHPRTRPHPPGRRFPGVRESEHGERHRKSSTGTGLYADDYPSQPRHVPERRSQRNGRRSTDDYSGNPSYLVSEAGSSVNPVPVPVARRLPFPDEYGMLPPRPPPEPREMTLARVEDTKVESDASLEDEKLLKMMLVKYTGGTINEPAPDAENGAPKAPALPDADNQQEITAGIQRRFTATIEDTLDEGETEGGAAQGGAAASVESSVSDSASERKRVPGLGEEAIRETGTKEQAHLAPSAFEYYR